MGRNIVIVIMVILVLIAVGFGYYEYQQANMYKTQADQTMKTEQMMAEKQQQALATVTQAQQKLQQVEATTMTVPLLEENNSGESGTATLNEANGKVTVTLALTGFINGVAQPAHIHAGDCPGVGKVLYPLTNVVNGQSTTTLNTTLAALKQQLPLAINVHKSVSQIGVYTACGALSASGSATISPMASGSPAVSVSPAK